MTLKLASALMAGTLLTGCASTMADDGMQTSASTQSSMSTPMANTSMKTNTTAMANPMVGGAAMMANRTIVQNASAAPNLTTLVKAVTAAGLGGTLSGPGPFTVFAPTNEAFDRLPAGLLDTLLRPESKPLLTKVLTYHVVPRSLSSADLSSLIAASNGRAMLQTVAGEMLTLTKGPNGSIKIDGMNGSEGYVTTADVRQSNGVVHVVNGVLVPTVN